MSERQANINWEALVMATKMVEPKIWGTICSAGSPIGRNSVGPIFGYNLFRKGFSNYDTAIGIKAELETRVERSADPNAVIIFIQEVASSFSDEEHVVLVEVSQDYPMMRVLRGDPVFGTSPKIPASIGFKLYYDRGPFII